MTDSPALAALRAHIEQVLQDYADGLLDSREEGVDAILDHPALAVLKLKVVGMMEDRSDG